MVRKSRKSRKNYRKVTRGRKSSNRKSFRRNTRKSSRRRRSKRRFKVGGRPRRSVKSIEREEKACTGYTLHRTRPFKRWRHNSDDCAKARNTERQWPTSWREPSPQPEPAEGESNNY
jgi:hypothetical protein